MEFDIKKYDNTNFHEDELINKRIKALLLWFEYEVYSKNISLIKQMVVIDTLVERLIKKEWYEIGSFFQNLKLDLEKKIGDN